MSDVDQLDGEASGGCADHLPTLIERCGNVARDWRPPRLHLVLGDAIARRARIAARFNEDQVLNRGGGGATWASLLEHLDTEVTAWQTAAAAGGLLPGIVIIWLTGNELYGSQSWLTNFNRKLLNAVGRSAGAVIARLRQRADEVLIFGPLPRLAGEVAGVTWEYTAAFHLERTLAKLDVGVRLIPLGRALTRKMGRNRHGILGCNQWFIPDGIHLSPAGYDKLADASTLPVWVTLGAASGCVTGRGQDHPAADDESYALAPT